MLNHPTIDRLRELALNGMAKALVEQLQMAEIDHLSFDERLGLLVDREITERSSRRLARRLKLAQLKQSSSMADIDYRRTRGLDKKLMLALGGCDWVRRHHNIIITGATGAGKSYIACALAHAACLDGYSTQYHRLPRLAEDLRISHGDGRYLKLLKQLARIDVLLLDDWGLAELSAANQRDILELLDDRHQHRSTIVTSQLPAENWHQSMADPTLADAILDRLVHNAHHIKLKGESMRKHTAELRSDLHEADHLST
jgi:DNA replication protein DnaC